MLKVRSDTLTPPSFVNKTINAHCTQYRVTYSFSQSKSAFYKKLLFARYSMFKLVFVIQPPPPDRNLLQEKLLHFLQANYRFYCSFFNRELYCFYRSLRNRWPPSNEYSKFNNAHVMFRAKRRSLTSCKVSQYTKMSHSLPVSIQRLSVYLPIAQYLIYLISCVQSFTLTHFITECGTSNLLHSKKLLSIIFGNLI